MTAYNVIADEAKIDEEVKNLRNKAGENLNVEDDIQEDDVLEVEIEELEGDAIKNGGLYNETTLAVDLLEGKVKEQVLTLKKGDIFTANIHDLDTKLEGTEAIKKYLLDLEEDEDVAFDETFQVTINGVKRQVPAEINEVFFEEVFPGEDISSEEEMRDFLKKDYSKYYIEQADKLLLAQYQRKLMEMHELELPVEFLKEWLIATNEEITEKTVEEEYKNMEKGLRWSFIQTKIAELEDIKVSEEEIEETIENEIKGYFGGNIDSAMLNGMMDRFMNDRNYVNQYVERILNARITEAIKKTITLDIQEVTTDEFNEIIKAYNAEHNESKKSLDETLTEQVEELVEDAQVEEKSPATEE